MLKKMIFGTFVLITVLLTTFQLVFELNILYLNNNDVLITHKKYYPVNKTSHNMIQQPTTSFFYFKVNILVIIKHLHSTVTDTNDINLYFYVQ